MNAPTGLGGYPTNRLQDSTPTGYQFNTTAHNLSGMTKTIQYGQAISSQLNTPNLHTAAGYRMQPFVQNHPNTQKYPIVQNQTHFHNVGVMVASPQAGVPRTQQQRQMFGNPHSTPIANQAFPSAHVSAMAKQGQRLQPAQPTAPQKSMDELVKEVEDLQKEDGLEFGGHIRNFRDGARYAEAERRIELVPTPELARDFPTNEDQQVALARGIFNPLVSWAKGNQAGGGKNAIKRIKSKKSIAFEIVAWKILVFMTPGLVRVDTS